MSVIDTPSTYRYRWYVRLLFWLQRRRYGRLLEPSRLWGRSPRVFAALSLLFAALNRSSSPIDPTLRALVSVRVSQINWCRFCVDINSALALERGLAREKLDALAEYATSPLFDAREKAVLAYAEHVTRSDRKPDASDVMTLREHFDDDAIVELTAWIAYQNLASKFNAALDVQPQGFCAPRRERRSDG